jgi:hypothetical protein
MIGQTARFQYTSRENFLIMFRDGNKMAMLSGSTGSLSRLKRLWEAGATMGGVLGAAEKFPDVKYRI